MQRFEDKVVLVTGAANGIGQATAKRIASEGGQMVCTDVDTEAVEATAKEIESAGGAHSPGHPTSAIQTQLNRSSPIHSKSSESWTLSATSRASSTTTTHTNWNSLAGREFWKSI